MVIFGDNDKEKIIDLSNILIAPSISIENVLLVEDLMHNLHSISQLYDRSFNFSFKSSHCIVTSPFDDSIKFLGKRHRNVYIVDLNELKKENIECLIAINAKVNESSWIWYNRLGNASMDSLARLIKLDLVQSLPKINFKRIKFTKHVNLINKQNLFLNQKILFQLVGY